MPTCATACTPQMSRGFAARVMAVHSYLYLDPEFRQWDAEVQGDLAVSIAHRTAVRGELITRATVFDHFNRIMED